MAGGGLIEEQDHPRGVEHLRRDNGAWVEVFGEDGDSGSAGNAPRFLYLADAALHGGADRNHGFAIEYDWLRDARREGISGFRTEGGERGFEFHLDGRARRQGSLRRCETCEQE